ncbi:aminoglycoside phosphotransferase family protein [Actinoplanes sp. NBC_00393]|uniref:phosphotransferase n=1 Tax=Actinoplanes sp. NBC_00393 TaxID=2975953 RepID=UPI002E1A2615
MLEPPAELAESDLLSALRAGWGVEAGTLEFLPLGAGSYQWAVADRDGRGHFVKVNELRGEAAFESLRRSLATALALRHDAGLDFVLAPVPARGGEVVRRLDHRYAVAVFPLLDGVSGEFGPHRPADRAAVVDMLADLHRAGSAVIQDQRADSAAAGDEGAGSAISPPARLPTVPRADLRLPGRSRLEAVLRDTARPWNAGPYAEATRRVLAVNVSKIEEWLTEFDRLAAIVGADRAGWVVTHGEPHPGNLLRTETGTFLIDWDTVQVAPPERDLWMLTAGFADLLGEQPAGDDRAVLDRYRKSTGRAVSAAGLELYRRWWPLADIAIYADELHRPHTENADLAASLRYLTGYLR